MLACQGPCRIPIDLDAGIAYEPHAAVSPLDPDHVVVVSRRAEVDAFAPAGGLRLYFEVFSSRDGGASWTNTSLDYSQSFLEGRDPTQPNIMADPVLAFLPDGTLLLAGATLQLVTTTGFVPGAPVLPLLANIKLFVVRSPDGGMTFEKPVVVHESGRLFPHLPWPTETPAVGALAMLELNDKPWIATGPNGQVLLTWTQLSSTDHEQPGGVLQGEIWFVSSQDGGKSWSGPGFVDREAPLQGSAPVIGSDGSWHVAYWQTSTHRVILATSHDAGKSWDRKDIGDHLFMPSLAVARDLEGDGDDVLFLVTARPEEGGTDHDEARQSLVLYVFRDGGKLWLDSGRVLDEAEAGGRLLPSVAVDARGVAYVTWAHALPDNHTRYMAIAHHPGGWLERLVLEEDIPLPASRIGDYVGLGAGPSGAFGAWVSSVDGSSLEVVGARLTGPDV